MARNRPPGRRAERRLPREARIAATGNATRQAREPDERPGAVPSFGDWLRMQLRSRRMSQRQLASRSGVNHGTMSRLMREAREPQLATATKLVRVLLELNDDRDAQEYVRRVLGVGDAGPAARLKAALDADNALDEPMVRAVMDYYLMVRRATAGSRDR